MSEAPLFNRLASHCRIKHLHLLVKIAELGSLQKAAAAVHLSQPAATQALASLENLLDLTLFERHARGMRPSLHGQALIRYAQQIIHSTSDMAEAAHAFHQGSKGMIRLVAVAAGTTAILAKTLPSFNTTHPDIEVEINEVEQERLLQRMGERSGDLFFCRASTQIPQDYCFMALTADRYVVVTRPGHPLLQRSNLELRHCEQESWLVPPREVPIRQHFDSWCESQGFAPRLSKVRSRALALSLTMIREHGLLGIFPYQAIRQLLESGDLAILPLVIPGEVDSLGVMWRPQDLGMAGKKFLDFAQQAL